MPIAYSYGLNLLEPKLIGIFPLICCYQLRLKQLYLVESYACPIYFLAVNDHLFLPHQCLLLHNYYYLHLLFKVESNQELFQYFLHQEWYLERNLLAYFRFLYIKYCKKQHYFFLHLFHLYLL